MDKRNDQLKTIAFYLEVVVCELVDGFSLSLFLLLSYRVTYFKNIKASCFSPLKVGVSQG